VKPQNNGQPAVGYEASSWGSWFVINKKIKRNIEALQRHYRDIIETVGLNAFPMQPQCLLRTKTDPAVFSNPSFTCLEAHLRYHPGGNEVVLRTVFIQKTYL
jgi:hypothetical protein